jgi:hypothetical protein
VTYCRAAICHILKQIFPLYNSIRFLDFHNGRQGRKPVKEGNGRGNGLKSWIQSVYSNIRQRGTEKFLLLTELLMKIRP